MYVKPVGLAAIKFMYTEWMNPDDPRASARYNLHAYNLIWGYLGVPLSISCYKVREFPERIGEKGTRKIGNKLLTK